MSLEWDKPECFQAAAPNRHPFLLFYHFPPFSSSINPMNPLQRKKRKKKLTEISRWRIQLVDASFHLFFEKEKLKKNLTQGRGIIIPDRTSIEKINKFHEIYLRSSNRRLSWTSWLSRSNLHGFLRGRIFHWKSRRAGNVVRSTRKREEGGRGIDFSLIPRLHQGCMRVASRAEETLTTTPSSNAIRRNENASGSPPVEMDAIRIETRVEEFFLCCLNLDCFLFNPRFLLYFLEFNSIR